MRTSMLGRRGDTFILEPTSKTADTGQDSSNKLRRRIMTMSTSTLCVSIYHYFVELVTNLNLGVNDLVQNLRSTISAFPTPRRLTHSFSVSRNPLIHQWRYLPTCHVCPARWEPVHEGHISASVIASLQAAVLVLSQVEVPLKQSIGAYQFWWRLRAR